LADKFAFVNYTFHVVDDRETLHVFWRCFVFKYYYELWKVVSTSLFVRIIKSKVTRHER